MQVVLVTTGSWDATHGTLRTYERDSRGWHAVGGGQPVVVGRSGSAWGTGLSGTPTDGPRKKEGDNRSPAGVFRIGDAFGYAASADTQMKYRALQAGDYCIDATTSPLYNRIVDTRDVGEAVVKDSTEPMRRDLHVNGDQRYRLGFVIENNANNVPGAGSCIFAHIWHSSDTPTAGCTAMELDVMQHLLAWLRPERKPVFVLMPERTYATLWRKWQLPAPEAGP
jgi:L,D-peptidoglycan transpeptidase YkuD (ErfK/YbiS/YcfS/YnhG family)